MQCFEIREDNGTFLVVDAYSGDLISHPLIPLSDLDLADAVTAIDRLYEVGYESSRTPLGERCIAA